MNNITVACAARICCCHCGEAVQKGVHVCSELALSTLLEKFIVPRILASEKLCELPESAYGIVALSPKDFQSILRATCWNIKRIATKPSATDRFQLPPITIHKDVYTSKHASRSIFAVFVSALLTHCSCNDIGLICPTRWIVKEKIRPGQHKVR